MVIRILVAAVASTFLFASCGGERGEGDSARRAGERATTLAALAGRHGADNEWREQFEDAAVTKAYTSELQNALIKPNGQPVVFVGVLDDVVMLEEGQCEVWSHSSFLFGPEVHVVLKFSSDQVRSLFERRPGVFEEFALVARVVRVWKPILQVSAESVSGENGARGVFGPPGVVFVEGQGLEIVSLER